MMSKGERSIMDKTKDEMDEVWSTEDFKEQLTDDPCSDNL